MRKTGLTSMTWLVYLCVLWACSNATHTVVLVTEGRGSLSHMVLGNNTLFIGATNYIYGLDLDLEMQTVVTTGPQNDSQKCGIRSSSCSFFWSLLPTDNHNRILLLYSDKLVVCGSVFQGKCEIRNAKNISEILLTGDRAVASNELDVNTIAFVTKVLNSNTGNMEAMLYVATEFTRFSSTRNSIEFNHRKFHPLVSIRLLEDLSVRGSIEFKTDNKYMKPGLILYVTGFVSRRYNYILFNEKDTLDRTSSKLVHMCRKDDSLNTFLEMPITCKSNEKTFNVLKSAQVFRPGHNLFKSLQKQFPDLTSDDEVLVGLFSRIKNNSSALCIFSMPEVRKTLLTNMKKCLNGSTAFSAREKYKDGLGCTKVNVELSDDELLCSNTLNVIIAGGIPLVSTPVIQFPVTNGLHNFVSLALTVTTEFSVAFLGSSTGQIRKVILHSSVEADLYDSPIVVDRGRPINPDMLFDSSQMFLYVMSDRKVARIPVQNCHQYTTCNACLRSKDPYCGWCIMEKRCSLKSQCSNPTTVRWINITCPENCITILNVSPPMIHVSQNTTLNLTVSGLPRGFNTSYNCAFDFPNGIMRKSHLVHGKFGVQCRNPSTIDVILNISDTLGHINITMGIESVETGKIIVSTAYLIYKCSSFSNCSQCVDNDYSCDWCVAENKCQYNTDPCSDERVSNQSSVGKLRLYLCPMVDRIETGPIFIPQGQIKIILIQGRNFPVLDNYSGRITLPSRTIDVLGKRISGSELKFYIDKIDDTLPRGVYQASMNVLWTDKKFNIENDRLTLTLYSCVKQAEGDCSFCKNLELTMPVLDCRWCEGECVYSKQNCSESICPRPSVANVFPNTGHYLGGTVVTITGSNLGVKFTDIENNITIAGVACNTTAKKDDYKTSRRLRCVTGSQFEKGSGAIQILGVKFQKWIFSYKDPQIISINPNFASKSGGRHIYLRGENLNIGNGPTITINNYTCLLKSIKASVIVFAVPAGSTGVAEVEVRIDGHVVDTGGTNFSYVEVPTILSIDPLISFQSGGRRLTLSGTNFNTVDSIRMFVIYSGGSSSKPETCTIQSNTVTYCPTPAYKSQPQARQFVSNDQRQHPAEMTDMTSKSMRDVYLSSTQLAFYMDDVLVTQDLNATPAFMSTLNYVPDPIIYDFEESDRIKTFNQGIILAIKGSRLNEAATTGDVKVFVGLGQCNVTSLTSEHIYCIPPSGQPHLREDGKQRGGIPRVFVVYGNLDKMVGFLRYENSEPLNLMEYIVLALLVIAGIVIITVFVFCLRFRRQLRKAKSENRSTAQGTENIQLTTQNESSKQDKTLATNTSTIGQLGVDDNIISLLENKQLLISPNDLKLGKCIGQGNFGIVYEGTVRNTAEETKVAVKTLHQKNPREIDVDEFVNEALRMSDFHHPNVMTLIGICLSMDDMPLVVLPYMKHGDVLTYIRDKHNVTTVLNILQFAVDIAKGMEYLCTHRVVHRDLAARNCMLDENKTVLVADFGLSRDIYEKDYYVIGNKKSRLPVKWMAPESLEKGIYNAQSDVWSFGVVMWELMTRGSKPYPGVEGWEMLRFLKSNHRLTQPHHCPDLLYSLMVQCWNLDPEQRTTISYLVLILSQLATRSPEHEGYMETSSCTYESLQNSYVNVEIDVEYSSLQEDATSEET